MLNLVELNLEIVHAMESARKALDHTEKAFRLLESARASAAASSIADTMDGAGDGSAQQTTGLSRHRWEKMHAMYQEIEARREWSEDYGPNLYALILDCLFSDASSPYVSGGSATQPPHSDAQPVSLPGESCAPTSAPNNSSHITLSMHTGWRERALMAVALLSGISLTEWEHMTARQELDMKTALSRLQEATRR